LPLQRVDKLQVVIWEVLQVVIWEVLQVVKVENNQKIQPLC
jgi:hypothetical protein